MCVGFFFNTFQLATIQWQKRKAVQTHGHKDFDLQSFVVAEGNGRKTRQKSTAVGVGENENTLWIE